MCRGWRRGESNPRHSACEADALPLSYAPIPKSEKTNITIQILMELTFSCISTEILLINSQFFRLSRSISVKYVDGLVFVGSCATTAEKLISLPRKKQNEQITLY